MKFQVTQDEIQTEVGYGTLNISPNEEEGYRPFQLMVASLAGCSASVYRKILNKQKVEFEEMTIDAEVERTGDDVNKIEKVTLNFKVKGQNLNQKKLEKGLQIASKNCSMVQSVIGSIEVVENVEIIGA
ncbi:OsmC family protein [Aquisalibacillus elongatus]|uniref:Putative OsmC-like protein n=1 Tax=Aquisalibacillus elongatus TaxID=485577 RepID=A0A3N5B4U2_9BACI|nr:OsmC family protein [Aquisalibacillus elongatus]RPF50570.1 putative OsmC-like protein [Aquisalibacillus elongatus]